VGAVHAYVWGDIVWRHAVVRPVLMTMKRVSYNDVLPWKLIIKYLIMGALMTFNASCVFAVTSSRHYHRGK
jgi:hypothetical protein